MIERKPSPIQQAWDNFDAWWLYHGHVLFAPISDANHLWVAPDRIWYPKSPDILAAIDDLAARGVLRKAGAKNHGVDVEAGYREDANPSGQVVVHRYFVEVDFDLFSPIRDLASLIRHAGEVIRPGATDPLAVAKGLRKRGIQV